jgi:hypothetical protein
MMVSAPLEEPPTHSPVVIPEGVFVFAAIIASFSVQKPSVLLIVILVELTVIVLCSETGVLQKFQPQIERCWQLNAIDKTAFQLECLPKDS